MTAKPKDDRYLSTLHVARLLKTSRHTVMAMLADGRLQGERIAGRLVVLKSSLPEAARVAAARKVLAR